MPFVAQVNYNVQTQTLTGEADGIVENADDGQRFVASAPAVGTPTVNQGVPNGAALVLDQYITIAGGNTSRVRNPR